MSKATDYLNALKDWREREVPYQQVKCASCGLQGQPNYAEREAWNKQRPQLYYKGDNDISAHVESRGNGGPVLEVRIADYGGDANSLTPEQAIKFAHWIIETFGEPTRETK